MRPNLLYLNSNRASCFFVLGFALLFVGRLGGAVVFGFLFTIATNGRYSKKYNIILKIDIII